MIKKYRLAILKTEEAKGFMEVVVVFKAVFMMLVTVNEDSALWEKD